MQEHPYGVGQLDEMVELMVETICSRKEMIRISWNPLYLPNIEQAAGDTCRPTKFDKTVQNFIRLYEI